MSDERKSMWTISVSWFVGSGTVPRKLEGPGLLARMAMEVRLSVFDGLTSQGIKMLIN